MILTFLPAFGLRKCSGRGPRPMKRAGSCRRNGNHFSNRTTNGNDCLSPDARPVTTRRWINACIPWITRVGHSRRSCTLSRSATETGPLCSFSASRFAVATASCKARLIPTPPAGDMACAESPMQRSPSRHHWRRRLIWTVSSLIFGQSSSSATRSRRNGASSQCLCEIARGRAFDLFDAAFGDNQTALVVIVARD